MFNVLCIVYNVFKYVVDVSSVSVVCIVFHVLLLLYLVYVAVVMFIVIVCFVVFMCCVCCRCVCVFDRVCIVCIAVGSDYMCCYVSVLCMNAFIVLLICLMSLRWFVFIVWYCVGTGAITVCIVFIVL